MQLAALSTFQTSFEQNIEKDIVFDWGKMKKARDRYICRLNGIYEDGLDKLKVNALFQSTNSSVRIQLL